MTTHRLKKILLLMMANLLSHRSVLYCYPRAAFPHTIAESFHVSKFMGKNSLQKFAREFLQESFFRHAKNSLSNRVGFLISTWF